jgi:dihydropyrimidinase/allantoinase
MDNLDMAITSNNVFVDGRLIDCSIGIKEGKIVSIGKTDLKKAEVNIEAKDKIVLPGTVDPHVHIKDPGQTDKKNLGHTERETFETGTQAAAAGGVTTVIEMPNCTPPAYSAELVRKRMERAESRIVVDVAFFGAAGIDHLDDIIPCSKAGVVAFKTFLTEAPEGREKDFEGFTAPLDGDLYEVMKKISATNLLGTFHAENNSIINHQIKMLRNEGKVSPIYHAKSRPPIAEIEATSTILLFAEELSARVQICHIASPKVVELVNNAKRRGIYAIAETCPQYLLLTEESLNKYGPYAKCNPPLRNEEEQKAMWGLVNNGSIDTIGSDHSCNHTKEEKERGRDDIFKAPSGFPGIEQRLPLLFTKVREGKLRLDRMVDLICKNPAKIFGLYPRKGMITVGADADFVIIDPNKKEVISSDKMFTKAKGIAKVYEGWEVYGKPDITIVRGNVVFKDGKIKVSPGYGKIIKHKGKKIENFNFTSHN